MTTQLIGRTALVWSLLALLAAVQGKPAEVDGYQFSFEDEQHNPDDVILLNVGDRDRLDYNIDNDDGTYQYGYQSGQLEPAGGYSFKHEYKRRDGVLFGQHGYQLPSGHNQTVSYVADARGYRVLADGQQYEPVSEQQLARQRHLLDGLQELEEEEEEEPVELSLSLLDRIENADEVQMEADPEVALAATPVPPYSQLDPETGAFRFGFRSVSEDGVVSLRREERRPDGVVLGQYGQRAAAAEQPGTLVSYVSDAFGYRLVDPAAPVPVVSREQALRQLPEELIRAAASALEGAPEPEAAPEPAPDMMDPVVERKDLQSEEEPEAEAAVRPTAELAPSHESWLKSDLDSKSGTVLESKPETETEPELELEPEPEPEPAPVEASGDIIEDAALTDDATIVIDDASGADVSPELKVAAALALAVAGGGSGLADDVVVTEAASAPRRASLLQLLTSQYASVPTLAANSLPYHGQPTHHYDQVSPYAVSSRDHVSLYESSAVHQPAWYSQQRYRGPQLSVWYPFTVPVVGLSRYQGYPAAVAPFNTEHNA